MQMAASGADFIKGTFTIPADHSGSYELQYGRTFESYLILVELTDESKTVVINTGTSNYRPFCYVGVYPYRKMINSSYTMNVYVSTYNPSSDSFSNGTIGGTCTENSITVSTADITGTASTRLMKGCSYNYYIVEIK